ncbi:hypothetical protein [Streptomyces vietnamensis]|uniref:hypothetical protein n=1 Tax=Streptomyces vietnamensis TaxID=362257 RepID=UPI00341495D3
MTDQPAFEYRDEDGDDLIVRPMRGIPAIMILTGTNGIAIDLDRVEEVVAGIRDAARQTTGCVCGEPSDPLAVHRPDGPCYMDAGARQATGQTDTEPQDHPGADLYVRLRKAGEDHDTAQQLIYAHARMAVRQHVALNGDASAVGQPAEAQATDEAHPADVTFTVEKLGDTDWLTASSHYDEADRDKALSRLARRRQQYPDTEFRLVRETTTWTVEDER